MIGEWCVGEWPISETGGVSSEGVVDGRAIHRATIYRDTRLAAVKRTIDRQALNRAIRLQGEWSDE